MIDQKAIARATTWIQAGMWTQDITTTGNLGTILACLRECAERREGCEWCKAVIVNPCKTCDAQSIGGNACGEYMSCGSYYRYFKATERQSKKYCDNCGRKMERGDT